MEVFFIKHSQEEYDNITSNFDGKLLVDREYPFNFNEAKTDSIIPKNKTDINKEECTVHKKSLRFTDLDPDELIVIPTIKNKYSDFDFFEMKIKSDTKLELEDISLIFSDSVKGEPPIFTLSPYKTSNIEENTHSRITFQLNGDNGDYSTDLSHIKTIAIQIKKAVNELFITDLVFKKEKNNFTIEDMDLKWDEGVSWIKDKLGEDDIPSELEYLIPKAAAFLIWRSEWSSEGKFQEDDSKNYKNYSQELKSEILESINTFLEEPEEPSDGKSKINTNLIGWV